MRAYCAIREQPYYRRDAFVNGLRAAGYEVRTGYPGVERAKSGDLLVIWNRYSIGESNADAWERDGGTVIVAENGYVARGGGTPKFANAADPQHYYALALRAHNGRGRWLNGGPERWGALDVPIRPWRADGEHVLVCPNRVFGQRGFIMPEQFGAQVAQELARVTRRPVRIRAHPGNGAPLVPLSQDLSGAWAVVIWASSAGVHALLAGVPVFCLAPWWICKPATCSELERIEQPPLPDRRPALERMAWAQWTVSEIASGEPFKRLRDLARQ